MTTFSSPATDTSAGDKTSAEKRAELQSKIDAAQARNETKAPADYAREARDQATSFVKEHPVATVVGGLALGAVIAAIVPGPGRRLRKKASKRGTVMAGVVAELAAAYGAQFLDGAEKAAKGGRNRLGDLGDAIGDTATRARRTAGSLTDSAGDSAHDLRKAAARSIRNFRSRMHD